MTTPSSKDEIAAPDHMMANRPRQWTVSVALPGTVMGNMASPQLKAYMVSQIARIAAIFCINEVVVFSESGTASSERPRRGQSTQSDPDHFLVRLLRYLETPQFCCF